MNALQMRCTTFASRRLNLSSFSSSPRVARSFSSLPCLACTTFPPSSSLSLRGQKYLGVRQQYWNSYTRPLTAMSATQEGIPEIPIGKVGDTVESLPTPCLFADLDVVEANHRSLLKSVQGRAYIRPHAKACKSAKLCRWLCENGCVGVCVSKLSEAVQLVQNGVLNVHVSGQVVSVDGRKERVLSQLSTIPGARISVCVDSVENVQALHAAAKATGDGARLHVIIEVESGQKRCGVPREDTDLTLRIADVVKESAPYLQLDGLQVYHGMAQQIRSYGERKEAIALTTSIARLHRDALLARGHPVNVVTGAGTGSYLLELGDGGDVFTEVQPGSYLWMDRSYVQNLNEKGYVEPQFKNALFVATTVISVTKTFDHNTTPAEHTPWNPYKEWAIVDAGSKAVSVDMGPPAVQGIANLREIKALHDGLEFRFAGDEHGLVGAAASHSSPLPQPVRAGAVIVLVPGHCDTTVNMYDFFYGVRKGIVEAVYRIEARGPGA